MVLIMPHVHGDNNLYSAKASRSIYRTTRVNKDNYSSMLAKVIGLDQ